MVEGRREGNEQESQTEVLREAEDVHVGDQYRATSGHSRAASGEQVSVARKSGVRVGRGHNWVCAKM